MRRPKNSWKEKRDLKMSFRSASQVENKGVVPKAEKPRKEYEVHGSEKHKAAESREERNSEKSNEKYGAEDSRGSIFPYRRLHVVAPIVTESASLLLVFSKWLKHRNVAIQIQSSNFPCACAQGKIISSNAASRNSRFRILCPQCALSPFSKVLSA